jgi:hypothetical protein
MEKEVLKDLHILSNIFENLGYEKEAQVVNEVFVKVAKKKAKKKSSGKNVPNNPSLWAECQAWAKRTYEIHPSAYSNAGAARRYRQKGGTWRKSSSESNFRLAQEVTETETTSFSLPGGESDQAIEKNPQLIYQQAINQIKNLIVSNRREDANTVFSNYFNGTDLSPAQKTALQNQYNSILDRFTSKDKDFNLSNPMAQQYLLEEDTKANTYVANFIKRLGIPRTQITNNSRAFSDVSKMISTIKDINIRYKAIDVLKGIVNMNSQTSRLKP